MRLRGVPRRFRMVLVVDDFESIQSPAREFFEAASFIVLFAGNGLDNSQACADTAEKGRVGQLRQTLSTMGHGWHVS